MIVTESGNRPKAVFLHLSDLQFGSHHRFSQRYEGGAAYATLLAKTIEDLEGLNGKYGLRPQVIVLTGDISESSTPEEYAHALTYLTGLVKYCKISPREVVLTPGNHDVSWQLAQAARLRTEAKQKDLDLEKFENYVDFLREFGGATELVPPGGFIVHEFRDAGLLIVAMNSCVKETDIEHSGCLGIEQVHAAAAQCDKVDRDRKLIRIAAMHHNFLYHSQFDNECLRDADLIRPLLDGYGFKIVLHGHRHVSDLVTISDPSRGGGLLIAATGSMGLDSENLPDCPNQYQLVEIGPGDTITLYMRQFSAQTIGMTGLGKFTADTTKGDNGIVRFLLPPDPPSVARTFASYSPDDLKGGLDAVEARAGPQAVLAGVLAANSDIYGYHCATALLLSPQRAVTTAAIGEGGTLSVQGVQADGTWGAEIEAEVISNDGALAVLSLAEPVTYTTPVLLSDQPLEAVVGQQFVKFTCYGVGQKATVRKSDFTLVESSGGSPGKLEGCLVLSHRVSKGDVGAAVAGNSGAVIGIIIRTSPAAAIAVTWKHVKGIIDKL